MFSKVDVNGPNAHPVWKFLKSNQAVGTHDIGWNFDKFLVNKDGHVVKRVKGANKPFQLEKDILALLEESGCGIEFWRQRFHTRSISRAFVHASA